MAKKETTRQESVRPAAEVSPKKKEKSEHDKLMEGIGAPSWNPIPPGQTRWPSEQPNVAPVVMLWSWIIDGTLDHKTGRPRSPYVVDEHGNEQHLEDAAKKFGWDMANARKYWKEARIRGFARPGTQEEGKKRIYPCGKLLPEKDLEAALAALSGTAVNGRTKGEKGLRKPFSLFLRYPGIEHHIDRLPPDRKASLIGRLEAVRAKDERLREDLEEVRHAIIRQEEDSIFGEFGIPKTRIPLEKRKKLDPKRKAAIAERKERVKPLIKVVERFTQTFFAFGEDEVYENPKNEFTETSGSLLNTEKIQRENVSFHKNVDVSTESSLSQSVSPPNGNKPTDRLTEIALAIPHTLVVDRLAEPVTVGLLQRIAEKLGDTPVEFFRHRIEKRWKVITSLGLLIGLAADAAEVWKQGEAERRKAEEQRRAAELKQRADAITWTRRNLDDPATPDEDRPMLLQLLRDLEAAP